MKRTMIFGVLVCATVSTAISPAHADDTEIGMASRQTLREQLEVDRAIERKPAPLLRVSNDEKIASLPAPTSSGRLLQSTLSGGVRESGWLWNGERQKGALFDPARAGGAASTWKVGTGGDVAHPWGKTKWTATLKEIESGFRATPNAAPATAQQGGEVALVQNLQIGSVTGAATLGVSQNNQAGATANGPAILDAARRDNAAQAAANLRWQMSPQWAFTTQHTGGVAGGQAFDANGASNATQLSTQSANDVGLEWKWSRSLALSIGAGQSRSQSELRRDDVSNSLAAQEEERAVIGLSRRTSGGAWGMQWTRRDNDNALSDADKLSHALSLQAERKLLPWLNVKGSWGWGGESELAQNRFNEQAQRGAEAQITLSSLGRFAVRYNDWQRRQLGLTGTTPTGEGREYGVRYNIGDDKGFGLSVEYNRRADGSAVANNDSWRLGVTYR